MLIKNHLYILLTILFTVYSQLVIRWQMSLSGSIPSGVYEKTQFILTLLLNPWVISSVLATFFAGVSWMLTMTKFEISYAYPFVSLNYILVVSAGFFIFGESISTSKILGSVIVVVGLLIVARG